jgi:putative glutamine amidotransferase
VGVTQRCDAVNGRDEVRDALDVRLCALLWELGFLPIPLASHINDHATYFDALALNAVVLSGGNDLGQAPVRERIESELLCHAADIQLPVLGVCRGMQMMNHHQGGRLRSLSGHVGVRHLVNGPLIGKLGREVNSYHNQGILEVDLADSLVAVAWSGDGAVEALRHRNLPWLGVMWHPEREQPVKNLDRLLIQRHLDGSNLNLFSGDLS